MSKTLFTPALTTVIGVLASTLRSADSSKVSWAFLWTPPRPPVAKTLMPASEARWAVAATVVAPESSLAAKIGRSLTEALWMSWLAMISRAVLSNPMFATPLMTAIVAGTTFFDLRISSNSLAASRFLGLGRP